MSETTIKLTPEALSLGSRLAVYLHDMLQFESMVPFIKAVNRPLLILCEQSVNLSVRLPEYVEAIDLDYTQAETLAHNDSKLRDKDALCHALLNSIISELPIEGVVMVEYCHCQEQMLCGICIKNGIPAILLRQPSLLSVFDTDSMIHCIDCGSAFSQAKAVNRIAPTASAHIRKLNLGCGRNIMPGWINADIERVSPTVFQMDASMPFPFMDNTLDYVFSEHMFEHLDLTGQQDMLGECLRTLNPGGVLRIATPDFGFLVGLINHPDTNANRRYIEWSFRKFVSSKTSYCINQEDYPTYVVNNFMHAWGHSFIHTAESLVRMGMAVGFSSGCMCTVGTSEHPALCGCEMHQNEIPEWANLLETMVVELRKADSGSPLSCQSTV